jgi:chloride channel 7
MFGTSAAGRQGAGSSWCHQVDANLTKLFLGPPGTISRLHYDAGDAHGWLAQVVGRKLFVLYPPSDGAALYPLASETETVQSPIEPLQPDMRRWPGYTTARPQACIVHPGEGFRGESGSSYSRPQSIDSSAMVGRGSGDGEADLLPRWAAGQALLIPAGWWHYAVALDRSITVQRNFYHVRSNAAGLVRMVAKTAAALRKQ